MVWHAKQAVDARHAGRLGEQFGLSLTDEFAAVGGQRERRLVVRHGHEVARALCLAYDTRTLADQQYSHA